MAIVPLPGPLAFSMEDLPGPAALLEGPDGRVGNHNAAFAEWAGRADLAGLALADLLPGDPGAVRLWHEARSEGAAEHCVERRGQDGESSFWSLRARRTHAGVLVCAGDLTAVARAAQAVHAAERDYVAVAAHELRAPLSAIKAWASALDGRRDAGNRRGADAGAAVDTCSRAASEGLGAIARQVDRMNELLTDLFDAALAGAGAIAASPAPVAVEALVRRAVAASPHGAYVDAGPLRGEVFVDAPQIEALIGRVLGWVFARAPASRIAVAVVPEGAEIHVVVGDPGPDIPRAAESEVFGRSLRARRRRPGLGLYLCQQLAAANGGRIFRERTATGHDGGRPPISPGPAGAPARIVLSLPRHDGGAETPPTPDHSARAPGRRAPAPARVLVGDADPERRGRLVSALRLDGHEAEGAACGAHFFEALAWGCDVVVVDLLMPGLAAGTDGRAPLTMGAPPPNPGSGLLAALERIRAAPVTMGETPMPPAQPAPPAVVVLSPSAERPEALDGAERAGALAVLGRPLDWPHLLSLVGCAAAARATSPANPPPAPGEGA